jgi:hypothetical protein
MAEFVQPGFVRLRCVSPQNHFEGVVGIGHQAVPHDDEDCILVPRGEHANALLRAGYVIAD